MARQVYETILKQTTNGSQRASVYNQLGLVKFYLGEYQEASTFYNKALEIHKKTLPTNHLDLAAYYKNIDLAYENMGNYCKVRSFYERAVDIGDHSLPSNHSRRQKW
jgi:tetratricopeptide (TPR) repeat protein